MTVGISHTYGGTVVVVIVGTSRRWDLSPAMALAAADQCETLAGRCAHSGLMVISALGDREFRFAGDRADLLKMAADLRRHAQAACAAAAPGSECWNCGGDGEIADCWTDYECTDPEGGCDFCRVPCEVCEGKGTLP